jgi:hypothetical protein
MGKHHERNGKRSTFYYRSITAMSRLFTGAAMSGAKIIEGLKAALAGDLSRVSIDGRTWTRVMPGSDPGTGWQPIETAPRDGTPIEVCNTRHRSHPPVIVKWSEDGFSDMLPEPHWCDAATASGDALYYNGRYFDFWKPTTPLPAVDWLPDGGEPKP